jgi:hypothetical protein
VATHLSCTVLYAPPIHGLAKFCTRVLAFLLQHLNVRAPAFLGRRATRRRTRNVVEMFGRMFRTARKMHANGRRGARDDAAGRQDEHEEASKGHPPRRKKPGSRELPRASEFGPAASAAASRRRAVVSSLVSLPLPLPLRAGVRVSLY